MIPFLAAVSSDRNSAKYFVGYDCCLVGQMIESGTDLEELLACWFCGKETGTLMRQAYDGLEHPVYSMISVAPSGSLDV